MTGRAAGYCAGYAMPGYANPVGGRGMGGRGMGGGGRGWRHRFFATGRPGWQRAAMGDVAYGADAAAYPPQAPPMSREQQLETLKQQAAGFADALEEIRTRIEQLQTDTDDD